MIVFSHGSVNDPINSAHLPERIAAAGFIVAAPTHVTDTHEDARVEFINGRLGAGTPQEGPNKDDAQPRGVRIELRLVQRPR
jgi:predicted dienelactone hydrolase